MNPFRVELKYHWKRLQDKKYTWLGKADKGTTIWWKILIILTPFIKSAFHG